MRLYRGLPGLDAVAATATDFRPAWVRRHSAPGGRGHRPALNGTGQGTGQQTPEESLAAPVLSVNVSVNGLGRLGWSLLAQCDRSLWELIDTIYQLPNIVSRRGSPVKIDCRRTGRAGKQGRRACVVLSHGCCELRLQSSHGGTGCTGPRLR